VSNDSPDAVADPEASGPDKGATKPQSKPDGENRADVAILGGGPCGLYAALTLAKAGKNVVLLEKESVTGGLARGHQCGENFYDLGVHMLHAFDQEVFETVKGIMGDERIEVPLDARIKWAGSFYRYPLQFGDMVKGMNPFVLAHCSLGLLLYQAWYKLRPREPQDAEEALIQLYGKPLYRFFFKEFTTRYWGFPPTELSATFITTKMPRLSAVDVIKKVLGKFGIQDKSVHAVESALSEETLHYSRNGAEAMARLVADEIERLGCRVIRSASVCGVTLDSDRKRITAIAYENPETGERGEIACDEVISTIPLKDFITSFEDHAPANVLESAKKLRSKAVAVYGLLVKKEKAIDALYIYYRDHAFHRVGEPKNAGLKVRPPDHTVLIVEMTCEIGDAKWNCEKEALDAVIADLEEEGICTRDEIVETNLLRTPHGYPVFDLGFEEHLETVQSYLDAIENVQSTGRQGGFCYPNMHKAMRMGADAADRIVERSAKK